MKRFSLSVVILIAMLTLVINFTSCKKLSKDVLKANGHLAKANKFYGKENFKAAVIEYEKALKMNPELKKMNLQLYIASCYSSMYKASIQPPENQELLSKIRENASLFHIMKAKLTASSNEENQTENKLDEFKVLVIENAGKKGGEEKINEFLNNEENGLNDVKDLAVKFISKEKEIYAITNTYSPIDPKYREKIEENEFYKLKIKDIEEYIENNSDADDLDAKREGINSLKNKIIENETLIENTYVKNKDFYAKRKKNIELKKEIKTGEEYFNAIPKSELPVEKDDLGRVIEYESVYDFIDKKLSENKSLEVENREMNEYFSKKQDIDTKKIELDTKSQTLEAMENYSKVKEMVDKIKEDNQKIKDLKSEVIDLIEKKDDLEGSLITEYSEKYDVFSEKLLEDIDNNKEVAKLHDFLKTVKGYETVLNKINNDKNYIKLNEDILQESSIISKNDKFLDTVKGLEEIKLKIRELDKYSKLLNEGEKFLASVKNLEGIIDRYKANEELKQSFEAEMKKSNEEDKTDVTVALSNFGSFEYENVDYSKRSDGKSNKKFVLSENAKKLKKKIDANKKYFSKIKNFEKTIEVYNQIDNFKKKVKADKEFLSKLSNLEEIKTKVNENLISGKKIANMISEKKKIAKSYFKKLKNGNKVAQKFEKIVDLENKLLQNKMFYSVSEGFEAFKTKFDEMISYQEKINQNGILQENLNKEIDADEKLISENENYKKLSELIREVNNIKYKIKANSDFISMVEKKYKKGTPESRFEEVVLKYNEKKKKINENKAMLDTLNQNHEGILNKFKIQEARIKEEIANNNYFEKATKNEEYKKAAISNLTEYIKDENNANTDKKKALTLLSDIYKKIAQSASDDTTKNFFFEKTKVCYDELLKDAENDKGKRALALYSKAKFYDEFGKNDLAKQQYYERIKLDPYAPDGYYYLAAYLQDRAEYDEAIENHKKRIYALIDKVNGNHDIIDEVKKIDDMREVLATIKNKELYIQRTSKYIKSFDAKMKAEFLAKKKELADIKQRKAENIKSFKEKLAIAYETFKNIDPKNMKKESRKELAKAFYTLGVVYWTKSYRTAVEEMHPNLRLDIINKGFKVLDESIRLDPNYPEPWSYKALLWVQMKKINPDKREEYAARNKEDNKMFVRLIKKRADMKRFEEAQKKI